jgi:uncharacterized protein YecA (UPF0149 family)
MNNVPSKLLIGSEYSYTSARLDAEAFRRRHLPGRNEPCPCKSGKKYKHCCLHKRPKPPPISVD